MVVVVIGVILVAKRPLPQHLLYHGLNIDKRPCCRRSGWAKRRRTRRRKATWSRCRSPTVCSSTVMAAASSRRAPRHTRFVSMRDSSCPDCFVLLWSRSEFLSWNVPSNVSFVVQKGSPGNFNLLSRATLFGHWNSLSNNLGIVSAGLFGVGHLPFPGFKVTTCCI